MDLKKYFYINQFKDSKNRMIYYDHFKKSAFRIPKEAEAKFKTFQGRGLYSVAIFFLLYNYNIGIIQNILITIGFYIITTAYFYLQMVPTYKTEHNFDLEERQHTIQDRGRAPRILLIALYVTSIALIVYLAITGQDRIIMLVAFAYSLFAGFKIIQNYLILKR